MRELYQLVMMVVMVGGDPEQLVVETTTGIVRGERKKSDLGRDVDVWASIPYAEPPVGSLRSTEFMDFQVIYVLYCQ